jgi:hypothetical protein
VNRIDIDAQFAERAPAEQELQARASTAHRRAAYDRYNKGLSYSSYDGAQKRTPRSVNQSAEQPGVVHMMPSHEEEYSLRSALHRFQPREAEKYDKMIRA